jgi:inner membrane protein involved in colicin E2 resistance
MKTCLATYLLVLVIYPLTGHADQLAYISRAVAEQVVSSIQQDISQSQKLNKPYYMVSTAPFATKSRPKFGK